VNPKASYITSRDESMSRDDEMLRYEFPPGEEPTVYTAHLCAEVGHEHCEGIDSTLEGYEGEPVFSSAYAIA
jgi:hypothetical protein